MFRFDRPFLGQYASKARAENPMNPNDYARQIRVQELKFFNKMPIILLRKE